MAKQDDENERKRRAEELRGRIDRLRKGDDEPEDDEGKPAPDPSPRDFIEKRMRELGEKSDENSA